MRLSSAAEVLRHLEKEVYVRLKPSKIHGIGVFAIRDIPQGIDPFQEKDVELDFIQIPLAKISDTRAIPQSVKRLVRDLCSDKDGVLNFPRCGLNGVMPLYYLNHSTEPNMEVDTEKYFRARRLIREGEELTVDYRTYSDETKL